MSLISGCRTVTQAMRESVCMTVSPEASAGVAHAYPVGLPSLTPVCQSPCVYRRDSAAQYILRQTFVAEIPVTVRSGVRVSNPVVRLRGATVARRAREKGASEHDMLEHS